jgi:polyisoprenoid-binding protein YceI
MEINVGAWKSCPALGKWYGRAVAGNMPVRLGLVLTGALGLLLVGCASAASATPVPAPPTAPPTASPTAAVAETSTPPSPEEDTDTGLTITLQDGSLARYLVREQLAGLSFPNDAIGETSGVAGSIVLDGQGRVDSDQSQLTVDLASLRSDEERRDNFLRNRSLESSSYPTARFTVREAPGLPWPLPSQGEHSFQLVGDMTLREVTRPLTWDVTARFDEDGVSGQAQTSFTFDEFQIAQPSVRIVLSVADEIRLELDFIAALAPEAGL